MESHSAITLLRGGIVLTHGANDQVIPVHADLLIKGNLIHEIAPNIQASADTKVIDCTEKILCPGFIDTHHHLWQTLLKGRHANELLLDYMYSGNLQSSNHTATDIFWGQLSGCLESLNAGTTTVVDHAHMNYSSEHSQAAIAATVSSGLRSVFCYTPTSRLDSWSPFAMNQDLLADWVIQTLENLAEQAPFGNGRVELGFGFDGFSLPNEKIIELLLKVKALGIKLITSHYARSAVFGENSRIAQLASYNLLDESILFSHASFATRSDAELVKKCNARISSTPSTELQMGMGNPVAFSSSLDIQSHSSLGIDCHTVTSASIPAEMRLLLQTARNTHSQQFMDLGKAPSTIYKTVEEAFNLGTIAGARAVGMEAKIGSLSEGKLADIVVFDTLSPGMVAAAQRDPVAAVVLHSSPEDIVMTIVDGLVRKEGGKLNRVQVAEDYRRWVGGQSQSLEWNDVAKEVVQRSRILNEKIAKLDLAVVREEMMKAFHIDPKNIVDSIPDI